jgi:C2H2-type zinc finger
VIAPRNPYNIRPRSKRKFVKFYPGELVDKKVKSPTPPLVLPTDDQEYEEEYLDEAFLEAQGLLDECYAESIKENFLHKEDEVDFTHEKEKELFCEHCGESFESLKPLESHVKLHHFELSLETEKVIKRRRKTTLPLNCEECGEVAFGKVGLFTHRWNKHFNIKIVNKKYHCTLCREVIKCASSARRHHSQVHDEGRKLFRSCLECNVEFKLYQDFKCHVEEVHEFDRSQFVCMVCGLLLNSSIELSLHTKLHRAVPEEDKKLSCDLCGFRAQQKVTIESHMVKEHGARKKDYHATCEVCGVTFGCYQSFHSHQMTHLDPSERKFKCNFCGKSFTKPALWRDHERIHTNPEGKTTYRRTLKDLRGFSHRPTVPLRV